MIQQNDNKKSKMTARQEVLNQLLDGARKEVIYAEIQRDFLTQLEKDMAEGKADVEMGLSMFGGQPIRDVISNFDNNYNFSLHKLNFLKDLRKKENEKQAVKLANKIKSANLPTIKVDLVEEK